MVSKTDRTRLYSRLLAAASLPLLLILVWWLHGSLAFVQNTTDSGVGLHWSTSRATLNLRVGCPPNNPLTEYGPCWDDAAKDAAARWNAAGAEFRFHIQSPSRSASVACDSSATDGITTVVWADTNCGMAFGNDTLAITQSWFYSTGELVDSDVLFDTNKDWTTYSGPQRSYAIDFHRVALHEFGHVLGLDHPDDHGQFVNAIMNSRTDDNDQLQTDDIAGIRAIYGSDASRGQPDPNYCRDFGPCPAGKGDCDSNSECQSGLTCVNDVGAKYGLPAHYDVCEAGGPDPDYCVYNYCGPGDGDCDPGQCDEGVCVNDVGARYGLPAHYDVCEAGSRPDPDYCVRNYCGLGDGDCDPGQCDEGICVNDVGARYGLPAHYDVCEARGGGSSLNDLLGTWRFRYTIISTFTSTYRLSRVDTSTGTPLVVGINEYGNPVVAGRIQDVNPGNPLPYELALLEPSDFLFCRFFVFNKTGSNSVEGFYFQIDVRNGVCGTAASDISNPYPMTGIRTSRSTSSIQEQSPPRDTVLRQPNAELQSLAETTTLGLSSPDEANSAAIRDMINMLSSTLD